MDELDEFMKQLENAGILSGWTEFMKEAEGCERNDTQNDRTGHGRTGSHRKL